MHNKVVFRAAKSALLEGLPTLRFNFRGVGRSAGEFGGSVGEKGDVRAALDYLQVRFPTYSVCLMGFSFGAWVGLNVGGDDSRVVALVGLGLPIASMSFEALYQVTKPKLIVQGTLDQYSPRVKIQALFEGLKEPKRLHWVENADHFFAGKLSEVEDVIRFFLRGMLAQ